MTEELMNEAEGFNKLDGIESSDYLKELVKEELPIEEVIDKLKDYYEEK